MENEGVANVCTLKVVHFICLSGEAMNIFRNFTIGKCVLMLAMSKSDEKVIWTRMNTTNLNNWK